MRIGQTSLLFFLGKVAASILGFVATIYFARLLGASVLGIYYLTLSLLTVFTLASSIGISNAVVKRISEGEQQGQYLVAGLACTATLFVVVSFGLIIFQNLVDSYIDYSGAAFVIIILMFAKLSFSYIGSVLKGYNLVYAYGVLKPTKLGLQTILQVTGVILGFGLFGLFGGKALGSILIALLTLIYFSFDVKTPSREHFRSLLNYAKYAWLGNVEGKAYRYTDILVLGAFVPSGLVGVYGVAWAISDFLRMFGSSVSTTVFPEISKLSAEEQEESIRSLINDALSYAGLILIPGLVGAAILGEHLLWIYGEEFVQGTEVLVLLVLGGLFHSYQKQLTTALSAVDRPDLSFRVNLIFIVVNISLNVILISQYGWIGAAIATSMTAVLGCFISYMYGRRVLKVRFPYEKLAQQSVAALIMGSFVWTAAPIVLPPEDTQAFLIAVPALVAAGATLYFVVLFLISKTFRTTVRENIPINV